MAESSSAGPRPAERHSIGFSFAVTVAVPVACLALLWTAAAAATVSVPRVRRALGLPDDRATGELILFVGGGVLVVGAALLLIGLFARRLSRDVAGLATAARHYADEVLPGVVSQLHDGPSGGTTAPPDLPVPRTHSAELAQAIAAIARLEQAAATAAAGEAGLRDGLRAVFVSLARRNQSLLQRQLRLIDTLEQKASDPAALADLFALDHLTTRMRRHAESLAILSGAAPGRSWTEPVPVIDVIRAAIAEVEDYQRVTVLTGADDAVSAPAVADMIHLLAELIENATMFSPSGTRVEIRAERVANGFAIEIEDRGLGIEPAQLSDLNRQLASPPDFDLANADRLGLFVGAKLAVRHGVRVSLRASPYGGTSAIVLLPSSIMTTPIRLLAAPVATAPAGPAAGGGTAGGGTAGGGTGRFPALDLHSADALGLPAQRPGDGGQAAGPAGTGGGRGRPGARGTGPGAGPAPDAGGAPPPGPATQRRLPQRTRQASLSPHLRGGPETGPSGSGDRSPEQARHLAASLQTGWRRGRAETEEATPWPPPAVTPLDRIWPLPGPPADPDEED
jgi:signal transduction histidine kinase